MKILAEAQEDSVRFRGVVVQILPVQIPCEVDSFLNCCLKGIN